MIARRYWLAALFLGAAAFGFSWGCNYLAVTLALHLVFPVAFPGALLVVPFLGGGLRAVSSPGGAHRAGQLLLPLAPGGETPGIDNATPALSFSCSSPSPPRARVLHAREVSPLPVSPGVPAAVPADSPNAAPGVPADSPCSGPVKPVFSTSAALLRWHTWLESRALARKTISGYISWGERMAKRWDVLSPDTFPQCVEIASASLRRQGYSATTIHGFQCAMASWSECLFSWKPEQRKALITARPVRPKHQVPDVEEIGAFLKHLEQPARIVALLCYCCGLRISEAVSLQLEDCNLSELRLTVKQSKFSKGRVIPIPPELVPALKSRADKALNVYQSDVSQGNVYAPMQDGAFIRSIRRSQEPGQWPLFPQPSLVKERRVNGYVRVPLHPSRVEKAFRKARSKAQVLTKITPHRLRDAYAVHSICAGVPVRVVQEHMGHHSLETTAKYLSYLVSDEGMKAFTGLNLFHNLNTA